MPRDTTASRAYKQDFKRKRGREEERNRGRPLKSWSDQIRNDSGLPPLTVELNVVREQGGGVQPPGGQRGVQPPGGQRGVLPPGGQREVQPPGGQRGVKPPGGQRGVQPPAGQRGVQPPGRQRVVLPPGGQRGVLPLGGQREVQPPGGQRGVNMAYVFKSNKSSIVTIYNKY